MSVQIHLSVNLAICIQQLPVILQLRPTLNMLPGLIRVLTKQGQLQICEQRQYLPLHMDIYLFIH